MQTVNSMQAAAGEAWAPSILPMLVWYWLNLLAIAPGLSIAMQLGAPFSMAGWISFCVFVITAVLAHKAYSRSKAELAADPSLRGRWFVDHAWWAGLLFLLALNTALSLATFYSSLPPPLP